MSLVRNPATLNEMRSVLHQQTGIDQIADQLVLTADCNPNNSRQSDQVISGRTVATGSLTVYTTPNDNNQEFRLTSCSLAVAKDATCDMATGSVDLLITPRSGAQTSILRIPVLVTTAQASTISISFEKAPIPVDKNSVIAIQTATFTVGLMVRTATITGFIVQKQ